MTLLSAIHSVSDHSFEKIWTCYDTTVWTTLFAILFWLVLISSIILTSKSNNNLIWHFFFLSWKFFQTLLKKGSSLKPKIRIYCIFLLTIIPIISVFENILTANLVTNQEIEINSIEDVLNSANDISVTVFSKQDKLFIEQESSKIHDDIELRQKYLNFAGKIKILSKDHFIQLTLTPNGLVKLTSKLVAVEDDFSMQWIQVRSKFFASIFDIFNLIKFLDYFLGFLCVIKFQSAFSYSSIFSCFNICCLFEERLEVDS
jgi:hypothetical protein